MHNRDAVIRHATSAAAAHSSMVREALEKFLTDSPSAEQATNKLRQALVAQAAGFESTAANGSTFPMRVEAARAALDAWDAKP